MQNNAVGLTDFGPVAGSPLIPSAIFRASAIIGIFFGLNKLLGFLRQYIIVAQFGFSPAMDAFNVANNLPDTIFSLISGGTLAMAFIPVFAQHLNVHGQDRSWKLFSNMASIIFITTMLVSGVVAVFAPAIVRSQIGIAPGFTPDLQQLVIQLLRIQLIATVIFSLSGLVTSSLQAHKHFFLPALAPIFYNLGIIIAAVILAPAVGANVFGIRLPAFNLGIYGLTYGVVLGSLLHLLIQLPGLKHFNFSFSFALDVRDPGVIKIFRLMAPRLLTVLLIQVIFILRDNFASRLAEGSVTALTYGYFLMQVPETLIGTAIATALLPTLSGFAGPDKKQEFAHLLTTSMRVVIATSLICTALLFVILGPIIRIAFDFSPDQNTLLIHTSYIFIGALAAQTLLEILVRAFYARQKPMTPLYATLLRTVVFVGLTALFYRSYGVLGIAGIDSLAVVVEVVVLTVLLLPQLTQKMSLVTTTVRSLAGSLVIGALWFGSSLIPGFTDIQKSGTALLASIIAGTVFIKKELQLLIKL